MKTQSSQRSLCTTNVQILEILLSKFEKRPLTLLSPPLGGEDEGEGDRWILLAAMPRCVLCGYILATLPT